MLCCGGLRCGIATLPPPPKTRKNGSQKCWENTHEVHLEVTRLERQHYHLLGCWATYRLSLYRVSTCKLHSQGPYSYNFCCYPLQYHHYQYDPGDTCSEFCSHLARRPANSDKRSAETAFTTLQSRHGGSGRAGSGSARTAVLAELHSRGLRT